MFNILSLRLLFSLYPILLFHPLRFLPFRPFLPPHLFLHPLLFSFYSSLPFSFFFFIGLCCSPRDAILCSLRLYIHLDYIFLLFTFDRSYFEYYLSFYIYVNRSVHSNSIVVFCFNKQKRHCLVCHLY